MTYEEALQRELIAQGDKTQKRRHRSHEENMQAECVAWFDRLFPGRKKMLHHSPNGGARSEKEGAKFKRMGTRAGFPDLVWLGHHWNDQTFVCFTGIEFKYDKGRQEPVQREYEAMFRELDAEYHVIKTKNKFKELMVMLIEKAILSGCITLTKEEERSLDEAHKEVRENALSDSLIEAARVKAEGSRKASGVRKRKAVQKGQ